MKPIASHHAALGVEPIDGARGSRVPFPLCVERESDRVTLQRHATGLYSLARRGTKAAHEQRAVTLRLYDRRRRYVPRRIALDVSAAGSGVMVRPVLYPGAAFELSELATAMRGQLATERGEPVRWARIALHALGRSSALARAHGDDRGEFYLLVPPAALGARPLTRRLDLELRVFSGSGLAARDAEDPLADLPLESDLSGLALPDGYSERRIARIAPETEKNAPKSNLFELGAVTFSSFTVY